MATSTAPVRQQSVPGFALGTTPTQIRDFRDKHLLLPAEGGTLDPQALQAWALLERAAIAAEANQIALLLNDGDAVAIQTEIERLSLSLGGVTVDLSLLLLRAEAVIAAGTTESVSADNGAAFALAHEELKGTVEDLRKKFAIAPPPLVARPAIDPAAASRAVPQADGGGDPGDEAK